METPRVHEDSIRARAYSLWEAEGCPDGCADRHWQEAEAALLQDAAGDRDGRDATGARPGRRQGNARTNDATAGAGRSRRRG